MVTTEQSPSIESLYKINIRDIWTYLKTETTSFWMICIYLFFEYVRPQTLYPAIDIIPYAQLVIICTLVISLMQGELFRTQNSANKLVLVYFGIILISSVLAYDPAYAYDHLVGFITWLIIYFLIVNIVNTERRFFIFLLSFLLYSFKMSQFSFRNWLRSGFSFSAIGSGGGPGWFENSGEFGIQMCVYFPLAFYFIMGLKQHWSFKKTTFFTLFPFTALTGMISSSSRGALLGGVAIVGATLIKAPKKFRALIIIVILCGLAVQFIPEQQKARINSAGDDVTSQARIEHWKYGIEIIKEYPLLGIGYFNWLPYYNRVYGGRELCHNIFIQCASELGLVGMAVFIMMIAVTFINNRDTRRIAKEDLEGNTFIHAMAQGLDCALIGFIVSGFFVTVLYYPYFWINLAMTTSLNAAARNLSKEEKGQ